MLLLRPHGSLLSTEWLLQSLAKEASRKQLNHSANNNKKGPSV